MNNLNATRSALNANLNGDRDKGVWPVLRTIRVGDSGRLVQGPCAERRADSRATSTDAQRRRELCTSKSAGAWDHSTAVNATSR